jgi:hypothetical protein
LVRYVSLWKIVDGSVEQKIVRMFVDSSISYSF